MLPADCWRVLWGPASLPAFSTWTTHTSRIPSAHLDAKLLGPLLRPGKHPMHVRLDVCKVLTEGGVLHTEDRRGGGLPETSCIFYSDKHCNSHAGLIVMTMPESRIQPPPKTLTWVKSRVLVFTWPQDDLGVLYAVRRGST